MKFIIPKIRPFNFRRSWCNQSLRVLKIPSSKPINKNKKRERKERRKREVKEVNERYHSSPSNREEGKRERKEEGQESLNPVRENIIFNRGCQQKRIPSYFSPIHLSDRVKSEKNEKNERKREKENEETKKTRMK